jgi:membrane protein YdbS with pleckstrin-like domain
MNKSENKSENKSDWIFAVWMAAIVISAILFLVIPVWREWLWWIISILILAGLIALFRLCVGAEREPC